MEREQLRKLILFTAGVLAVGGVVAGMPESGAASSKGGVNLPPGDNPKASPTAQVPEIKLTPTPQPPKPRP